MGVIAQYSVSYANPSTVGGTNTATQYFSNSPQYPNWNLGAAGVQTVAQEVGMPYTGLTPSSSAAYGQLDLPQFPTLNGSRFKINAAGYATASASTPTIAPIIQVNKGSYGTPSYATVAGAVASQATVANKAVAWNLVAELFYSPIAGTLAGYMSYHYANAASGGTDAGAVLTIITPVTGIAVAGPNTPAMGFVCGIVFSAGTTGNSASLTQFQIYQD
jgi:hypothetical protein